MITVLRQTRKERLWDVIVREWLKSPQNTFQLGSILTSSVGFCPHHSCELEIVVVEGYWSPTVVTEVYIKESDRMP